MFYLTENAHAESASCDDRKTVYCLDRMKHNTMVYCKFMDVSMLGKSRLTVYPYPGMIRHWTGLDSLLLEEPPISARDAND